MSLITQRLSIFSHKNKQQENAKVQNKIPFILQKIDKIYFLYNWTIFSLNDFHYIIYAYKIILFKNDSEMKMVQ